MIELPVEEALTGTAKLESGSLTNDVGAPVGEACLRLTASL